MAKFYLPVLIVAGLTIPSKPVLASTDLARLSAQAAVSLALQKNPDLQQAREDIRQAEYQITGARADALPQINGAWAINRVLKPSTFVITFPDSNGVLQKNRLTVGTDYTVSLGITLTQSLYVGGKVRNALKAAKSYRTLTTQLKQEVQQQVIAATLQAFNYVLLSRQLEEIARASLSQAERHLANVKLKKEVGAATDYDLLRAQVNVANMRPDLIEAENNVRTSLLKLKQVMGMDPTANLEIVGTLSAPDTTILAQADIDLALRTRPDVAIGQLSVGLQDKAAKIAPGAFLPTLSASTAFSYDGNTDKIKYRNQDWSTSWYAGLNLSVPLFNGLRNYAHYKQAKSDLIKAQTSLQKTKDAAAIEVQQGIMDFAKTRQQIASQHLNVDQASKAVELAENLYNNGKATQLEVLDAQLALQLAKTNMARALYAGTMADIALRKSLGRLDNKH